MYHRPCQSPFPRALSQLPFCLPRLLSLENDVYEVLGLPTFHGTYLVFVGLDGRSHGRDPNDYLAPDHDHDPFPTLVLHPVGIGVYHHIQQNEVEDIDHLGLSVDNLHMSVNENITSAEWKHTIVFGWIFSVTVSLSIAWR